MKVNKLKKSVIVEYFLEEMIAHRFMGASAFFDELIKRGYVCEFHKRRSK